jgi:Flp pilus assembly protein TadD
MNMWHLRLWIIFSLGLARTASAQPQLFYERYQAGREQLDRAQFEAAVTIFKAALAVIRPGQAPDPNIYVALGYAQMRLGRFEDAEVSFNWAQGELAKLTPTSREQLQANRDILQKLRGH